MAEVDGGGNIIRADEQGFLECIHSVVVVAKRSIVKPELIN